MSIYSDQNSDNKYENLPNKSVNIIETIEIVLDRNLESDEIQRIMDSVNNFANSANNHFWSEMSYKLRTPINSVIGATELLAFSCELTEEQKTYLEMIKNSINTLSMIIDNVLVPAAIQPLQEQNDKIASPVQTLNDNINILLAEDNTINQKLAVALLMKKGWNVVPVENGKEVLDVLNKSVFDIILMDIQMPVMDGFEATLAIREKEKITGEHTPIIALTAHALMEDREKCLCAGMDNYISKPFRAQTLYDTITETLLKK